MDPVYHASGVDRTHFFLCDREPCPMEAERIFRELIRQRQGHVPVQYLTGRQEFMGFSFRVNEHVLIPRLDTETLVLEAEKRIRPMDRVLDLCTGSGCIILSLAKRNKIRAWASDISQAALETARENARARGAKVDLVQSDLFENLHGIYDCIVSNPPYISSGIIPELMPEVREHEPWLALDGGEDGLHFYRRIAGEARRFLAPGGWLIFEIGHDQGMAVAELMETQGYLDIEIKKDLAGLDRVAAGRQEGDKHV